MMDLPRVIAVEEHYWDAELASHFKGTEASRPGRMETRLRAFDGDRIADMDAAGIDLSVLSHGAPSGQKLPRNIAVELVRGTNNRLADALDRHPGRFAAFAALPTSEPEAAADELERCVALGFKGAMLHGLCNGEWLDLPKFWPIYERAERLDVPIYFHPAQPHPAVAEAYYAEYSERFPMFSRPAWGYTVEAGTQAVRLVLSGVFERHPKLKVILGHLGESLPYQLWRIDSALKRPAQGSICFRDIFVNNFWVTTSGFFSTPALLCCALEIGLNRIMFAVDWPFVDSSKEAVTWLHQLPIAAADRARIAGGNAAALLHL